MGANKIGDDQRSVSASATMEDDLSLPGPFASAAEFTELKWKCARRNCGVLGMHGCK